MTEMPVWLIGAGPMAQEYAHILVALDRPFLVIGRGEASATAFQQATKVPVFTSGLEQALSQKKPPEQAIVAVGVEQLTAVASALIRAGTRRILLEKPGGMDLNDIVQLNNLAEEYKAEVLIAYNRRFYASVLKARECIEQDGGLLSTQFEFTEWAHRIAPLTKAPGVKERWLLVNSTHVIDLAFYLSGQPREWQAWHAGTLDWHPAAARFCGAGVTERGVLFSYLADWQSAGRWGLELLTKERRLTLRPMEQLQATRLGSVKVETIALEDVFDQKFKPGLYRQVQTFLKKENTDICTLSDQVKNVSLYCEMAGYFAGAGD